MQCSRQDGFTTRFPHHRRVDEPVVTRLQGRSLSRAVAAVPPIAEFAASDEAPLASGEVRLHLLGFSCMLHYASLHTLSIAKVAAEATVRIRLSKAGFLCQSNRCPASVSSPNATWYGTRSRRDRLCAGQT